AGHTQTVTTVDATPIVAFKSVLKEFTAEPVNVLAKLDDFKNFVGSTPLSVAGQQLGLDVVAGVRKDLTGGSALTLAQVLAGATAKVTGPQVKALSATLGAAPATD